MLRISLVGPGDIDYHFRKLLKTSQLQFAKETEHIARVLVESGAEIVLLPDRGVSFDIAKTYKECCGKKAIATVPLSDSDFGIQHLQPYLKTIM